MQLLLLYVNIAYNYVLPKQFGREFPIQMWLNLVENSPFKCGSIWSRIPYVAITHKQTSIPKLVMHPLYAVMPCQGKTIGKTLISVCCAFSVQELPIHCNRALFTYHIYLLCVSIHCKGNCCVMIVAALLSTGENYVCTCT